MTEFDPDAFDRRVQYQYDLFISYSSAQESEARAIYDLLKTEMAVFYAPETLPKLDYEPDQYVEVLTRSLTQSCQVLVLLSKGFMESSWCQLELYGYLNLCFNEERRRLWVAPHEEGIDKQIGGQFVPLIYSRDQVIERIRQRHRQAELEVGDRITPATTLPRMFVALPLYELYEPPRAGKRPPWGKNSRSPHGIPGAPPFDIYELMVREYMVQLRRRRAGKSPTPFSQEGDELELSIPMQRVGKQYDYMKRAARSDAEYMLSLGFLGHTGNSGGRLDGGYLFVRSVQARLQGKTHWELDLHDAFGRICMGQLEEIDRFEQAIERCPTSEDLTFYKIELAKAKYLARNYEDALVVLEPLEIRYEAKLVRDACLARLGRLADSERDANRQSDVRIDRIRMCSSMEDRDQLDFWAEALQLAGYRP
jgi:hypothetical protein